MSTDPKQWMTIERVQKEPSLQTLGGKFVYGVNVATGGWNEKEEERAIEHAYEHLYRHLEHELKDKGCHICAGCSLRKVEVDRHRHLATMQTRLLMTTTCGAKPSDSCPAVTYSCGEGQHPGFINAGWIKDGSITADKIATGTFPAIRHGNNKPDVIHVPPPPPVSKDTPSMGGDDAW